MTTRIASDWGHGSFCPTTQGRERLAREDERTSLELAIRCGLKSARGDAPKPPTRATRAPSRFTGPKPEPRVITKNIAERRKRTLPEMTLHGLRSIASKLRRQVVADPTDQWARQRIGECLAEFERRTSVKAL